MFSCAGRGSLEASFRALNTDGGEHISAQTMEAGLRQLGVIGSMPKEQVSNRIAYVSSIIAFS